MENNSLSHQFVESIKINLPDDQTIASYLMKTLTVGKEAVYRRIRGEIPFNFPEIVTIANDLDISIDNIINIRNPNKMFFEVNVLDKKSPLQNYMILLERQIRMLEKIKSLEQVSLTAAFNSIPYSFFLEYDLISSFQLYKYIFHIHNLAEVKSFSDFKLPKEIKELQVRCCNLSKQLDACRYIIDKRLFTYLSEDITLFYQMKLITKEEKEALKDEIINLLKSIETLAVTGKNAVSGKPVEFYVSNVHFDTSYALYESNGYQMAHFRLFSINSIRSNNQFICKRQKDWLETLIQSSTQITSSNAIFRKKYFKSQHDMVFAI